jgi:hypothetical protein
MWGVGLAIAVDASENSQKQKDCALYPHITTHYHLDVDYASLVGIYPYSLSPEVTVHKVRYQLPVLYLSRSTHIRSHSTNEKAPIR